jgi:hypothetical protein
MYVCTYVGMRLSEGTRICVYLQAVTCRQSEQRNFHVGVPEYVKLSWILLALKTHYAITAKMVSRVAVGVHVIYYFIIIMKYYYYEILKKLVISYCYFIIVSLLLVL